uniref:Uncharacterized protein n=1 Tax=Arion vulgaris TaxID=1028688 RepID=A0A0B6YE88_9EUPU
MYICTQCEADTVKDGVLNMGDVHYRQMSIDNACKVSVYAIYAYYCSLSCKMSQCMTAWMSQDMTV